MSRPSPPRLWHPPPSPGYDHAPPPDWYKRPEQQLRGRSPPRSYSPVRPISPHGDHQQQRPLSPRGEPKHSLSPRNERPSSPRNEQQASRRPISPIRPPSPRDRLPSPRREHPLSPRMDRPPSPRRDHPPSPGRDRPPSPRRERYSPRRDQPPSPGRDRPRSPYSYRSRSPPRRYYDWGRSRSPPPGWVRRSPPRYGPPPSGRSPPRGPWLPPPDWDRYPRPYPDRRSPPRWGPPPPHWERRWQPPPPPMHSGPPPPADRYHLPPQKMGPKPSPPPPADSKPESRGEDSLLPPDDKDEEIESFDLAPYDPDIPVGQKYVIAVSGFFCKVCHKFYNSESSAKITHCKTKTHYDKFAKWLSEKKVAALVQKRAFKEESKTNEPPAKQIKLEEPEVNNAVDAESKYDPSQPTADAPEPEETSTDSVDQTSVEQEQEKDSDAEAVVEKIETEQVDQNGETEATVDETGSESEALITSDTKNDTDADHVEATLFNLRKLKVNQLKANLEKRGMKSTGLKPLLLKRLEKVLAEETATVSADSEQNAEEETNKEANQLGDEDNTVEKEYMVKMLESDVEPANRKAQWLNERELERELLQLDGVKKVISVRNERSRVFNGRRTNVEWSITLLYSGTFPEDGLQFTLSSHQQLPFVAMSPEDEDV